MNADLPLCVKIVDGELIISIGISTLAEAVQCDEAGWPAGCVIVDERAFAREVLSELEQEDEIGTTLVHAMLDKAAQTVLENGSEHVLCTGD